LLLSLDDAIQLACQGNGALHVVVRLLVLEEPANGLCSFRFAGSPANLVPGDSAISEANVSSHKSNQDTNKESHVSSL
jgi:hypothetical protein